MAFDQRDMNGADGVRLAPRKEVLENFDAVFCLVTADQAKKPRWNVHPSSRPALYGLTAIPAHPPPSAARLVAAAGGDYIDMAVMAPVYLRLHRTPGLTSGPAARRATGHLESLGMSVRAAGAEAGEASSIKMLRSLIVKGLEALYAECFLAARRAGVEAEVVGSLIASNPETVWTLQGANNLERRAIFGSGRTWHWHTCDR